MHRIILDTNIIVSALIQKSYPFLIVKNCIEGGATICVSEAILKEYSRVLKNPKFSRFPDFISNANFFLQRILDMSEFYNPSKTVNIIQDDADNRFLELADASEANFLITGNTKDFTMTEYRQTKILSPKEYWERYRL